MNIDKAQGRVSAIHELGCKLDDRLESTESEIVQHDGGVRWLSTSLDAFRAIAAKAAELEGEIDVARVLAMLEQALVDLRKSAELRKLAATAKRDSLKETIAEARRMFDAEDLKLRAEIGRRMETGDTKARPRTSDAAADLQSRKRKAKKKATKKATKKTARKKPAKKKPAKR